MALRAPESMVFTRFHAGAIPNGILEQCRGLFSSFYGVWGEGAGPELVGKRVRMSAKKFERELLFDSSCYVVAAMIGENVVGHAACRRFHYEPLQGNVVWITQLVVHPEYRRRRVATNIITNCAYERSDVVMGLVSSNPFSVRALEKATHKLASLELIANHASRILKLSQVPYISNKQVHRFTVDTEFFVDHSEVNRALLEEEDWKLGQLKDGHEFICIVSLLKT